MGIVFSVNFKKVKSSTRSRNQKGFIWVRAKRFIKKKSIPRLRNRGIRYTLRSARARSLNQ